MHESSDLYTCIIEVSVGDPNSPLQCWGQSMCLEKAPLLFFLVTPPSPSYHQKEIQNWGKRICRLNWMIRSEVSIEKDNLENQDEGHSGNQKKLTSSQPSNIDLPLQFVSRVSRTPSKGTEITRWKFKLLPPYEFLGLGQRFRKQPIPRSWFLLFSFFFTQLESHRSNDFLFRDVSQSLARTEIGVCHFYS